MKIHPLTLKFRNEFKYLEEDYVASQYEKSLILQRVIIVLLPCLYAFFGILDFYVVPEKKHFFWFIRYALVCPFSFTVAIFSFTRFFRRFNNVSLFLLFIVGGFGIVLMILMADSMEAYSYYAGLILFLIGIHTTIRMRFTWAFAGSWLIIIFYEIIAIWLIETPAILLINNNFFIISANIICIIAGYSMERSFRRSFFLNRMLDREKEMVARKNRELKDRIKRQNDAEQALLKKTHEIEQIVMERTLQHSVEESAVETDIALIGGSERVLLIDDEADIVNMAEEMLSILGYDVTPCVSSVEGFDIFQSNPENFDLVITDMAMPGMPGDKLAVKLAGVRPDIPVLLCTGFSEVMSEKTTAIYGIKGFLMKPIVMQDFAQKIRSVLDEDKQPAK